MNYPENAFCNMPLKVLYCGQLTFPAIQLYGTISNLANMKGGCTASNKYFAELLGVDVKTVKRNLTRLEKLSFIKIFFDGKLRKIYIPFFSTFQSADNFSALSSGKTPKSVQEVVDSINYRQLEKYPYFFSTVRSKDPVCANLRTITLILAKAVYNPEYFGIRLNGQKITERKLWDLVLVLDIGKCYDLARYIHENLESIEKLDMYVLTSLFKIFDEPIKKLEHDRKIAKHNIELEEAMLLNSAQAVQSNFKDDV